VSQGVLVDIGVRGEVGAPSPVGSLLPRWSRFDVVVLGLVSATAYALKSYYSTASADQLRWALDPTTSIVEAVTGLCFAFERGAGFVSESRHLVIAPACAGVNFLVIALLSLTFGFVPALRTKAGKVAFALAGALAAYVAMLVVNAARISLHVLVTSHVHLADPYRGQAHRVEGVVIYLTALFVLMASARAGVERAAAR